MAYCLRHTGVPRSASSNNEVRQRDAKAVGTLRAVGLRPAARGALTVRCALRSSRPRLVGAKKPPAWKADTLATRERKTTLFRCQTTKNRKHACAVSAKITAVLPASLTTVPHVQMMAAGGGLKVATARGPPPCLWMPARDATSRIVPCPTHGRREHAQRPATRSAQADGFKRAMRCQIQARARSARELHTPRDATLTIVMNVAAVERPFLKLRSKRMGRLQCSCLKIYWL